MKGQQRLRWWSRAIKGPRRAVTVSRPSSLVYDRLVPVVLLSLAIVTVALMGAAAGVLLGLIPFR